MKTQVGICYICNNPVFEKEHYKIVGNEMRHTTSKCEQILRQRAIDGLSTRHPQYQKPVVNYRCGSCKDVGCELCCPESIIPIVTELNIICKFCKVAMEKLTPLESKENDPKVVNMYQCPKCRQTMSEEELRKETDNEDTNS